MPYERSLVKRLEGRPFRIVGVNGDPDVADARRSATEHGHTWRSYRAGPKGPEGPIPTALGVARWPYLVLIDHDGLVRYRGNGHHGLDAAIDAAIARVPGRTPAGGR